MPDAPIPVKPDRLKLCGVMQREDRDADDPAAYIVLHRNVGGELLRDKHDWHNPKCWCHPLVVSNEDSKRAVFQQAYEAMKLLN